MKNFFPSLFNRRKKIPIREELTIDQIQLEIGIDLTYPFQFVDDVELPKYKNLRSFGCSDIMDKKGRWIHRDCFIGRQKGICEKCNFYPIKKKYNEENPEPEWIKTPIKIHVGDVSDKEAEDYVRKIMKKDINNGECLFF